MPHKTNHIFEFEGFRLELAERRLLHGGDPVSLPPKVFDLLAVLVEKHGHLVEKEFLLRSLWPDSFVEESNLSVNVSSLRRALGEFASEVKFIETVPKRGYRFVAAVTQPEAQGDLPRNTEAAGNGAEAQNTQATKAPTGPESDSATEKVPSRKWVWAIAACIVLATVTALSWRLFQPTAPGGPIESVAVLPFMPLNEASGQEYLGLGMADAVATRIARIEGLTVRPTSSVLRFEKPGRDILNIGRELLVDGVVEGRVQHHDNRLRVTVQVWSVAERKQVWADTFDDSFDNIFTLQDEISARVAKVLSAGRTGTPLTPDISRYKPAPEAYQLYLQGQYLVSKRLNAATQSAIDHFEQAIKLDPTYPLPYAAVTHSYLLRAGEGLDLSLRAKAKAAAMRALELDESIPETHVALAQVMMRSEWNWEGAEREFRRAIELNPDFCGAHAGLSTLYTAMGRHGDAIHEMEIAVRLEPDSAVIRSDLSWTNLFGGRNKMALDHGRTAVRMDPWSYSAHRQLAKALLMNSYFDEAVTEATRALEINGGRRRRVQAELATVYARAGNTAKADDLLLDILSRNWTEPEPHYEMAVLYAAMANPNQAIVSLTKACDQRLGRVIWMQSDPEFATLRENPDFRKLVARLRLPK